VHDDVGRDAGAQLREVRRSPGQAFPPAFRSGHDLVEFPVQQQEDMFGVLDDATFGPPAAQLHERELGLQHGPHGSVLGLLARLVEDRARAQPRRQQAFRRIVGGHRLHELGHELFPSRRRRHGP
jgi:hypothetical protein